jgi:hypothetical protein
MNYVPKPHPDAYVQLCDRHGIDPARALFADDMARNLAPAKAIGMVTVWVDNGSEQAGRGASDDFIDYRTGDMAAGCTGFWETNGHERGPAIDHRRRLGRARRDRPRHRRRDPRGGGARDRSARRRRGARGGEGPRWLDRQSMAEEGGAALLPSQRHDGDWRRPRRHPLVGQGPLQIHQLGKRGVPPGGASRRPRARSCGAAPSSARARC